MLHIELHIPLLLLQVAATLSSHERPLTLLFCWLMAKERHVRKYAQFYTNLGIDVLKVRISPFDLLRPTKGSQVRNEVLICRFCIPHYFSQYFSVSGQRPLPKHSTSLRIPFCSNRCYNFITSYDSLLPLKSNISTASSFSCCPSFIL